MRKLLLTCLLVLMSASVSYCEPIPQQGPSSADTPYYMDSQNVLREKPKQDEEVSPEDSTVSDTEESTPNNNNDEQIDDTNNPINYDASQENVQDKNFKPVARPTQDEEIKQDTQPQQDKTKKRTKKNKKNTVKETPAQTPQENVEQPQQEGTTLDTTQTNEIQPTAPKTYSQDDYEQMYRDMPVPTFTFVHGVDPDQYYDMKDTTWSPYPLLRLNSPLYFKTITIQPGYYLLTPRKYKDDWYILFKEAGKVKYTIPVFAKDYTPEFYYRDNLKELDMGKSQRWQIKFLNAWGKYIRKSKRRPATKTNVELTDLDNNFLLIELYYGPYKYSTIFRIEKF